VTEQDDTDFLKKNLRTDSPQLTQAISLLATKLFDPETRAQTLAAGFLLSFCQCLTPTTENLGRCIFLVNSFLQIDALRSALVKNGGITAVSSLFLACPKEIQETIRDPLRNLASSGRDICKAMAESPRFIERLCELQNDSSEASLHIAAFLLSLANFVTDEKLIRETGDRIFAAVKGENEVNRNLALDILMEAALIPEVRPILLSLGVKELLQPDTENEFSDINFIACLIGALLSASDVSATNESGTKPTSPAVIRKIIEALQVFSDSSKIDIPTLPGMAVDCQGIFIAVRSLATNEANLKELKKQNLVPILATLFKRRRDDLFLENLDRLEQVLFLFFLFFALWLSQPR